MEEDQIDKAANLLSAMANPHRLHVLELLQAEGEMSVNTLVERLAIKQSGLSQHLAKLRSAGAVKTRRVAQEIYYSSNSSEVKTILDALERVFVTGGATGQDKVGTGTKRKTE